MNLERPSVILDIMNDLRWTDKFICLKCGNTKSIKGDDIYDRKCSKCKKNVSLTKYTAFEGLRFPIEKAYGIIETLIERRELDSNAKVIKWYNRKNSGRQGYDLVNDPEEYRNPENISDKYEYLSLTDLVMRSKKREEKKNRKYNTVEEMEYKENRDGSADTTETEDDEFKEKPIEKLLEEINNRWRTTIGMLARKFEIEENTVTKFLEKISNRIRPSYKYEPANPLDNLIDYINDYSYRDGRTTVKYFLGLAMVPMPREWKFGVMKDNGNLYGVNIVEKGEGEWSVYRMTVTHDKHSYTYHFHERIEYGTQEWYDLFHVNIDK